MQKYRPITNNIWIQIAAESLLIPFILDWMNIYAAKEKKYTATAKPVTIKRFGPSGSLKKKNSILEQMMAVIANTINEIFFDLKYRFSMLLPISIRCAFL